MNLSGWPFRMPVSRFPRLKVRLGALTFGLLCFFFQVEGTVVERGGWTGSPFWESWMTNWRNPRKTAKLQNPAKASFWTWMSDFLMVLKTWGRKVRNSSKMMITRSHVATVCSTYFLVCFRLLHHKAYASASTCQKPGKTQRMWLQWPNDTRSIIFMGF